MDKPLAIALDESVFGAAHRGRGQLANKQLDALPDRWHGLTNRGINRIFLICGFRFYLPNA
jgi:hypothetical protein